MQYKTTGFIGGGRITRIFLEGWRRAGTLPPQITVSDPDADTLARLQARFPAIETTRDNNAAAAQALVFLAVHPPVMADVAAGIKGHLKADTLVLSLAPKFTIAKLTDLLGGAARLVRVIPNAPSIINVGFNPVAFGPTLTDRDRAEVVGLLAPLGDCPEVAEEKLEAYAVLSAMGPTYLWFQLQALREVAGGFGLSDGEIATAIDRMVSGSTRTLLGSGLTPADVLDLIPVKPLAEMEPQVTEMYRTRLPGVYRKIAP